MYDVELCFDIGIRFRVGFNLVRGGGGIDKFGDLIEDGRRWI